MKYSYKEAEWKDYKLFLRNKDTNFAIKSVEHGFKIEWPDKSESDDFYNLDRAKWNCLRLVVYQRNQQLSKAGPRAA